MVKIGIIIVILAFIFIAGCSSQQNLHTVNFHIVDQNNTAIVHAHVDAIDPHSVYQQNYTDNNGNVTFELSKTVEYNILISNLQDGQQWMLALTPNDTEYDLRILPVPSTPIPTPKPTQTLYSAQDFTNDANYWTNIFTKTVTKYI